jgi:hypothetical protein
MDANPKDDSAEFESPILGSCCVCGRCSPEVNVWTILSLHKKSPTPGRGWGCVQCGLAADGATAVVCDVCFDRLGQSVVGALRFACKGYPGSDGRVPIEELQGEHEHDLVFHPELENAGFTE